MSAFWNYRVIECPSEEEGVLFQIHVVEYNEKGKAVNWSETGEASFGQTIEALEADLARQQSALEKPVLTVKRLARGYELVEVATGEIATSELPSA